jgi:hypothetical protein
MAEEFLSQKEKTLIFIIRGGNIMNIGKILILDNVSKIDYGLLVNGGAINKLLESKPYLTISNGKTFAMPILPNMYLGGPNKVLIRINEDNTFSFFWRISNKKLEEVKVDHFIVETSHFSGTKDYVRVGNYIIDYDAMPIQLSKGVYRLEETDNQSLIVNTINDLPKINQYTARGDIIFLISIWSKNLYFLQKQRPQYFEEHLENILLTIAHQMVPQSSKDQLLLLSKADEDGLPYDAIMPGLDIFTVLYNWCLYFLYYKLDEMLYFFQQREDIMEKESIYGNGGRNLVEHIYMYSKQNSLPVNNLSLFDFLDTMFEEQPQ